MRIVIADDHIVVRDGLNSLLEKEFDFDVIGLADNGRDAVRMVVEQHPDVVLMDFSMPEMNGIEATRKITEQASTRVIILSMYSERRFIVEALHAGARGYVFKDSAFEELASAIRSVAAGSYFLSEKIPPALLQEFRQKRLPSCESGKARGR